MSFSSSNNSSRVMSDFQRLRYLLADILVAANRYQRQLEAAAQGFDAVLVSLLALPQPVVFIRAVEFDPVSVPTAQDRVKTAGPGADFAFVVNPENIDVVMPGQCGDYFQRLVIDADKIGDQRDDRSGFYHALQLAQQKIEAAVFAGRR